jgi:membrane fusion protein (multidrug efflux system)
VRAGLNRRRLPALLAALSLAAGCEGVSESSPGEEPVPVPAEDVALAARRTIESGPRIAGSIEARRRAAVRAETGGSVVSVAAELGQAVKRGALLARLEDSAQVGAVRAAEVALGAAAQELGLARRDLARSRRLVRASALTARELESATAAAAAARSRVGEARARLADARRQLAATVVSAPIAGVVGDVAVHQGDVVGPGTPLFTVIDPSSLELRTSLPGEVAAGVQPGARVSFAVAGAPERRFAGQVERVAPAASPATGHVPILVAIPEKGGQLLAGLFAEGRIIRERRDALTIPIAAVDGDGDGASASVTRARRGQVERAAVELGLRDSAADTVEVVSGLEPGDRVLVHSSRLLMPGTRVVLPRARAAGD